MGTFEVSGTVGEFIEALGETTFTFLLPMATSTPIKDRPEPASVDEDSEVELEQPGADGQEKLPEPNIDNVPQNEVEVPEQAGEVYSCLQCDFTTPYKNNLTRHTRSKHEMLRFVCGLCHKKYITLHYLQCHIKEIHANQHLLCEQCATPAASEEALAKHMRTAHRIGGCQSV